MKLDDLKELGKNAYRVRRLTGLSKYEYRTIDGQQWKRWVEGPFEYFIEIGVVTGWSEIIGTVDDEYTFVAVDFDGVGPENIYESELFNIFTSIEDAETYKKEMENEQIAQMY